jgi:hypothetical protein
MRTTQGVEPGPAGRDVERRPGPEPEAEYEDEYEYEEYGEELTPAEAARAAARHVAALTGKELCGVVSLERSDDGWLAGVEVVEDRRIPSSNDVLGLYLTEVDADGELRTYRRSRRYARGRGDSSEVI